MSEVETLHIVYSITSIIFVPKFIQIQQISGKMDNKEKSGRTKKRKFHELLDLLCFQWRNLESSGA